MKIEPVTVTTPRPLRRRVLTQAWRELTFLHWPADPDLIAPLLPPGTAPDTLDGVTYVGLVPFRMSNVLRMPYLGTFPETNVRLYSVDGHGRRGVVFRSLDAARLLPVLIAQAGFSLPYKWASMRIRRDGDVVTYLSQRRGSGPSSRIRVLPGAPIAEPSDLEHFMTARWGLHVSWRGRTVYLPNEHPPWPLHRAELLDLEEGLLAAAGTPRPAAPPVSVLWSPGVPVHFGLPLTQ
ncbi:YqjF family protein [Kutzneria sp. NPDC052558]|uniref:YqjF family protein n=1 Tax=Kutzneria sp. NPDC052558 TaxID=3364121 RepID=UPI0037C9E991